MDQQKVTKLVDLKERGFRGYTTTQLLDAARRGLITVYLPCVKFPHGTTYRLVEQMHGAAEGNIVGNMQYGHTNLLPLYDRHVSQIYHCHTTTIQTFPHQWHDDRVTLIAPAGRDRMSLSITVCADDLVFLSDDLSRFIKSNPLPLKSSLASTPYELPKKLDDVGALLVDVVNQMANAHENIDCPLSIWRRMRETLLSNPANRYGLTYNVSADVIETEYDSGRQSVDFASIKSRLKRWKKDKK